MSFDFTICIPTFNRGKRAFELVNILLKDLEKNWSILVLDNASTNGVEFYNKIENLSKINNQIKYVRHETNRQFYGNFKSCLDYPSSKYIMIISDEDFVNFDEMKDIINELEVYENIGACRTSISPHKDLKVAGNSHVFQTSYLKAGEEALSGFCFSNNYISGIIYNLHNIKKTNLVEILGKNILSHKAYPHLYFDLLVSSKFDVLITSKVSILEGSSVSETLNEEGKKAVTFDHIGLYGYGERINQFLALRDGIVDAVNLLDNKNDNDKFIIFLNIYLLLVQKYFYLIALCNMPQYKNHYMEESLLKESFFYITCSAIFAHPQIEPYKEIVLEGITSVYNNYK